MKITSTSVTEAVKSNTSAGKVTQPKKSKASANVDTEAAVGSKTGNCTAAVESETIAQNSTGATVDLPANSADEVEDNLSPVSNPVKSKTSAGKDTGPTKSKASANVDSEAVRSKAGNCTEAMHSEEANAENFTGAVNPAANTGEVEDNNLPPDSSVLPPSSALPNPKLNIVFIDSINGFRYSSVWYPPSKVLP